MNCKYGRAVKYNRLKITNSSGIPILSWYERYRVKDKGVIDKINDTWKEINII